MWARCIAAVGMCDGGSVLSSVWNVVSDAAATSAGMRRRLRFEAVFALLDIVSCFAAVVLFCAQHA